MPFLPPFSLYFMFFSLYRVLCLLALRQKGFTMAKITLSPLVTDIRGKVGSIVFSKAFGFNTIRALVIPANPRTPAQRNIRTFMSQASKAWHRQSAAFKASFKASASGQHYSGFNLYVKHLRSSLPLFTDYDATLSTAANAGDTTIHVSSVNPSSSPSYLTDLGLKDGQKVVVGAGTTVYTLSNVDPAANTATVTPALAAAAAVGDFVREAGIAAPDGTAWTY